MLFLDNLEAISTLGLGRGVTLILSKRQQKNKQIQTETSTNSQMSLFFNSTQISSHGG